LGRHYVLNTNANSITWGQMLTPTLPQTGWKDGVLGLVQPLMVILGG